MFFNKKKLNHERDELIWNLNAGEALGKKNWVRISIGVERSMLEDAFARLKSFVARHVKSQTT